MPSKGFEPSFCPRNQGYSQPALTIYAEKIFRVHRASHAFPPWNSSAEIPGLGLVRSMPEYCSR